VDNRTLEEIGKDHATEVQHKIRNANAMYFKTREGAYNFWMTCHRKAMETLGITPKDMDSASPRDDGVMNSGFDVKNVRVEVNNFSSKEWKLGTYFYTLKPVTGEVDELAYFLSHVKYFDNPIRDAISLQKGKFRVITNVPYDESKKKIISFPTVANA